MRSGHLSTFFALLGCVAASQLGCTTDSTVFPPPAPSLTLLATGTCNDANIVRVTPIDVAAPGGGEIDQVARLVATGIDASNASGDLSAGTRVTFSLVVPEDELERLNAGFGGFMTTRGQEIPGQPVQSGPIDFVGRTASEQFYCVGPGTVQIKATIEDYSPAGGGDARTLETRTFPVRCMEPADYERACAGIMAPDSGIPINDGGADEGDMGATDGATDGPPMMAPSPFSIQFVPPMDESDLVIGIRGSGLGRPDSVLLSFRVTELNAPVPDRQVRFRLPEVYPPNVIVEPNETRTDGNGIAQVRILAGGTPGIVSVFAETPTGEVDGQGNPIFTEDRSQPVIIRAGVPSAQNMQLTCEHLIVPAFVTRLRADEYRFGAAELDGTDCTVQLGDRLNGRADTSTQVLFLTEAGTVTQAAFSNEEGSAVTRMRVGPPAPFNALPDDHDPNNAQGRRYEDDSGFVDVFNPRDGLVRLVAVTRGEEAFTDTNGNKIWDDGEPFQDLPEPYVDSNDNGTCDYCDPDALVPPGAVREEFRDTNRNGRWDEGNARWDGDTDIWTDTVVLWTGNLDLETSVVRTICNGNLGCNTQDNFRGDCPPADFYLDSGGQVLLSARFTDKNGNCLDGYEEGKTRLSINGNLATSDTEIDFASRCFVRVDADGMVETYEFPEPARQDPFRVNGQPVVGDGDTLLPLGATHFYTISDTADAPNEPEINRFTITVSYKEVGGDDLNESLTFTVCQ